ncbi:hypothetical protein [Polluticoccus soli]|uniref:hypothetical protein n=1 Tax=Polluticoccus soli TaxID=3034150 RepID=UPI0023E0DF24|nr:hypothetical protein [Flavipsychrobacter sp. JY13-12]
MHIAFGGLEGYISYFKNSHELNRHIGATSQPLNYQIGISIFELIVGSFAYFGKADARRSAVFPLTAIGLIFFHIIVAGSYIYYAFAIPLAALAIGWSFGQLKDKVYFRTAIYVVLILSAATFALKSAVVVATVPQRSEDYYYEAYAKNIPRDASVAGDFTYYYMAVKNNNPFEIIIENGPYKGITQYFLAKKVQYIVLGKKNPDIAKFEKLLLNEHYRLVSTVENKKRIPVLSNLIDYLPWFITTDYSYTVYKLIE